MTELFDNLLWLGNSFDARDPAPIFELGIEAVIDLAYEERPGQLPRKLIYCRFPLNDGGGNKEATLVHAIQTLVDFLNRDTRTLIACSAGLSRSPTIAAIGLALHTGKTPAEVVEQIGELKSLAINGLFWNEASKAASNIRVKKHPK